MNFYQKKRKFRQKMDFCQKKSISSKNGFFVSKGKIVQKWIFGKKRKTLSKKISSKTLFRIPYSYQSAHRPRSTLTSWSSLPDRSLGVKNVVLIKQKTFDDQREHERRCLQVNGISKSVHSKDK